MPNTLTLNALLESKTDPSRATYNGLAKSILQDPHQLSYLVQDDAIEATLAFLIEHSNQLATLFHRVRAIHQGLRSNLHPASGKLPSEISAFDDLASEVVIFHLKLLPRVLGIIEAAQVVELLVSALLIGVLSEPPLLQKLATAVANCGDILERLASDESGGKVLREWVCSSIFATQDAFTMGIWTQRLLDLIDTCAGKHGLSYDIQRWKTLTGIKEDLQRAQDTIERKSRARTQGLATSTAVFPAHMIALDPNNKKAYLASGLNEPRADELLLDETLKASIQEFGLQVPSSRIELGQAICDIEEGTTIAILRKIVLSFPCRLCKETLDLAAPRTDLILTTVDEPKLSANVPLEIDVFGTKVGDWKVLLSAPALKQYQEMGRSFRLKPQ